MTLLIDNYNNNNNTTTTTTTFDRGPNLLSFRDPSQDTATWSRAQKGLPRFLSRTYSVVIMRLSYGPALVRQMMGGGIIEGSWKREIIISPFRFDNS